MVNFPRSIYPTELKQITNYLHAAMGAVFTGVVYRVVMEALDVSAKQFARLLTQVGYSSLASRIVLPAILKDTWVSTGVALTGFTLCLLLNRKTSNNKVADEKVIEEIEIKVADEEVIEEIEVEIESEEEEEEITLSKEVLLEECNKILVSTQNDKSRPYSEDGVKAIAFALKELESRPDTKPSQYGSKHEPTNPVIPRLITLYFDVYMSTFREAIIKYKQNNDRWNQKEVIDAADGLIKMGFAISCLTLDDLKPFTDKLLSEKGKKRTFVEALVSQDSYLYKTFYFCTSVYHYARGCIDWGKWDKFGKEQLNYLTYDISTEHADKFYKEGTQELEWRLLYNEYCDRIRQYVDEEELGLQRNDPRHVKWTQKDVGPNSFVNIPDTQPT